MSQTPVGGQPQGWEHKLADRSSLPPASGEEKLKNQSKYVFSPSPIHRQYASSRSDSASGPEGSSGGTPCSGDAPDHQPPYIRWARTLNDLLEDAEGVRLFRKFVASAGGLHLDRLNFYFAVQGLRHETDPAKIRQVSSAIYKFLRKSQLAMPEELRAHVKQCLREDTNPIDKTIFDAMEKEVTRTIMETTYPAFLRSEAYIAYASAVAQPLSSPGSPEDSRELVAQGGARRELGPVPEGQEVAGISGPSAPHARLTRDLLIATQARRLQPDSFAVSAFGRGFSVYSAHLGYSAYCPSSRRDSEQASLSSGRADSDTRSLSGSSVDGMRPCSMGGSSRHGRRLRHHYPLINRDPDSAMVIPRTQRVHSEQLRVLPPSEFAPLLIEKLEKLKREQESKEKLERKLMEGESEDSPNQAIPPQMVAAAIREKLQLDDDSDQAILDQHVSRVWSERTPGDSPPHRARRRAPSALSADSGLLSDLPHPRRSTSRKTVTELTDSGVSVVSEGTSAASVDPRILSWMQEGTERLSLAGSTARHGRRSYLSSRTSSAERRLSPDRAPPLPAPHVLTQLDEARRRLQEHRHRPAPRSALPRSVSAEACTVVVLTFLDEAMPYRIKVPHAPLTLRIFKDFLPKKGNYRYFFKTECAELDNQAIQEEISNDSELLPLYDGKVMARVTAA